MIRQKGPWAGRIALVGFGCFVALVALEGLLRLGGLLYQSRPAVASRPLRAPGNHYRILCLGESTTAGVAWGDGAYPRQLERILNERAAGRATFTVVNEGEVATTTDVILAKLPERLEKYQPDIVVAMMGINDGALSDPAFQVGGSLRVWKLAKMLYHSYRPKRPKPPHEIAAELIARAKVVLIAWPAVALDLAAQATRLVPDDPVAFLILAQAQRGLGQFSEAVESYVKAVEADSAAVVVHADEARDIMLGSLDKALARFELDANALAARAIVALRGGNVDLAKDRVRRSLEIDPENVVALVIEGHILVREMLPDEAKERFERALALNPRLVELLAERPSVSSVNLTAFVWRVRGEGRIPAGESEPGIESWFRRSKNEFVQRFNRLSLLSAAERIARGETTEAAEALRKLADSPAEEDPRLQLDAYGQLAILAWQAGDAEQAEFYHQQLEDHLDRAENPGTRENYREMWRVLHERGIQLVAVQYPMRRLAPLTRLLATANDVVFVDNELVFKRALLGRPYTEIFIDLFAGDFGHVTVEGNRILAENIAEAILALVPDVRA